MTPKTPFYQKNWFLILGILLVSFNLRPSITAVGPLIPIIREALNLSNAWAGFLTTLPLLTFATFSLFAAKIGTRLGNGRAILMGMVILLIGSVIRVLGGSFLLYFGTALTGIGIVICNVLIIPMVKLKLPHKIGFVTGLYTTGMSLIAAIASGVSVPMSEDLGWGWKGALVFWVVLLFISILVWLPIIPKNKLVEKNLDELPASVWKSRLAWEITLFMGIQSLLFFTLIAWLPDMLIHKGLSPSQSGLAVSVMQLIGLIGAFATPILATRFSHQSYINMGLGICYLLGFGTLFSDSIILYLAGIGLVGLCMGGSISMAYTLIGLRTSNGTTTAALSGMAQSAGYYLAALGPLLFGMAFDIWGDWNMFIYLMLGCSGVFIYFGIRSGMDLKI